MNLHDLRAELESQVHQASARREPYRLDSVGSRVRLSRRRRKAAVVAAVALVAGAVLAPALLDSAVPDTPTTAGGPTFRQEVAGNDLLGAAHGDVGQSAVTLRVTPATTDLGWAGYCQSGVPGAELQVRVNTRLLTATSCAPGRPDALLGPGAHFGLTAAQGDAGWRDLGVEVGEAAVVRARLTDRSGRVLDDPLARIGFGMWVMDDRVLRLAPGIRVTEHEDAFGFTGDPGSDLVLIGHRVETVGVGGRKQRTVTWSVPAAPARRYVGWAAAVTRGAGGTRTSLRVDGRAVEVNVDATGGSRMRTSTVSYLVRPGRPHTVSLTFNRASQARGPVALLLYGVQTGD